MLKTPNLKVYMPFEGDYTEKINNYTINVGGTAPTISNDGLFGKCIEFNDINDEYLYINTNDFNTQNIFTINFDMYVKGATSTPFQGVIGKGLGSDFGVYLNPDGRILVFRLKGATNINTTISLSTWTNITCMYDGSTVQLFKNGVLISSATKVGYTTNTYGIGIGKISDRGILEGTSYNFNGKLDNIKIFWGKALPQSDIQRIMMGLHPLNG